jgi:hypothetical protein
MSIMGFRKMKALKTIADDENKLSAPRQRTLKLIADSGNGGCRPKGADLTTAFYLVQIGLIERFHAKGMLSTQYRITDAGRSALP